METQKGDTRPGKTNALWVVLAVVLAGVALGALWWWKAATTPVAAACSPSNLALSVGKSQTAEGTTFIRVVLTNRGKETCSLKGYPVASMLDQRGENYFTSDAQYNDSYSEERVTLAAGGKAHAVLGLPEAANFKPGMCGDMQTLRLYLPGGPITAATKSLSTELRQKVCPGFSVTVLRAGE